MSHDRAGTLAALRSTIRHASPASGSYALCGLAVEDIVDECNDREEMDIPDNETHEEAKPYETVTCRDCVRVLDRAATFLRCPRGWVQPLSLSPGNVARLRARERGAR